MGARKALKYLTILFVLAGLILTPVSSSQVFGRTSGDDAAKAAIELSELESRGRAPALYRRLHPDAKAIIPKAAVVGWYDNDFFPLNPQPISEIVSVMFVNWTWGVTGKTYQHTAEITFVQPFGTGPSTSYQQEIVRLVEGDDGDWQWFFGRSPEFVNEQKARFSEPSATATDRTAQSTQTGSSSESASNDQYTLGISCTQVDAVVGGVVYAYCDWPFMFSAPFYCIPDVAVNSSGTATFLCNTTFTKNIYNPDEVVLDFAPKRSYTVAVRCDVVREGVHKYETCNWPLYGPLNPECVVDQSRLTFAYEKFLLCKP